ncbi:MAG: hypothetical protein JRF54_05935 [Deltaproteobacteria bacterium]|nr:hypothetical protein [Deltaproteobacteria bacterium]
MPLHAVVIGERTLARGSEAQHVEWDANVRELLSKAGSQAEDVATLHVSMTEQQFLLDFRDEASPSTSTSFAKSPTRTASIKWKRWTWQRKSPTTVPGEC